MGRVSLTAVAPERGSRIWCPDADQRRGFGFGLAPSGPIMRTNSGSKSSELSLAAYPATIRLVSWRLTAIFC